MTNYVYKGFRVHYDIYKSTTEPIIFKADASVIPNNGKQTIRNYTKFHTEYPNRAGIEHQIKRMIENYIDFEWQKLLEMKQSY